MLDVRLLNHFIVAGTETVSMAERGLCDAESYLV